MNKPTLIHTALQDFAAAVTDKMTQITAGEPEDQLRAPFETFMAAAARALGWNIVCTGETTLPDRLGRPDYAVHRNQLLAGYVELKAAGVGATATRFRGHNRGQFKRFSAIPNLLYTDGNEWALYRDGIVVDKVVRLAGDVAVDGRNAAILQDAQAIEGLLRDFLSWQPFIPTDRKGKIDLKGFATLLAPLCRMLRDDVTDALKQPASPLVQLARDWRQLLFPDASDTRFADAYAQTVAFALLLGRSEGAVYAFEVSGLKVVQSWLKYRMKKSAGRKSSLLDHIRPAYWTSQFTTELLELLWMLEETMAIYPEQEILLKAVIGGDCFQADELPTVPAEMRKPPRARTLGESLFDTTL